MIRRETLRPAGAAATACRVILLDVTEITQARAALLAQQQFLQSVIDGVGDPVVVLGTDYQVLLMNQAARKVTSAAADLGGMTCYRVIHGRDAPCDSRTIPVRCVGHSWAGRR